MSENHRYYWLKLQETFFEDDTIDFIESQENGERYVLFYLKLCLKALKNEGKLIRYVGELLMPYDEVGIAKLTKTDVDTVRSALILFSKIGLIKRLDSGEIYLTQLNELIGTETSAAQRKRKQRINEKARLSLECDEETDEPKTKALTNAERQDLYRAKKLCEKNNHVPFIEDDMNRKRYGGNYYICFKREKCRCAICSSTENLCMHHIDGFDENKPGNNQKNKMLTLCRVCHRQIHAGTLSIPNEILESIDYYSNEDGICHTNVTDMSQEGHTDIEIDKELELKNTDKDISSDKPKEEAIPFPELKDLENETKTKKTSSRIRKTNNTFSKSDYNECMDIYYKNRVQLGKTHPVENTIYKIQSFQGIIKPYFEDYGVEVVKQAIKNSFYNTWAASTTYGLTVIFNRKKFDEYVSGSKGSVHTQQYKNNKERGSFASEVYGKEQNWDIE